MAQNKLQNYGKQAEEIKNLPDFDQFGLEVCDPNFGFQDTFSRTNFEEAGGSTSVPSLPPSSRTKPVSGFS